jgi:tripartite-type tricarboxylate transporter receptor subunit TctC
MRAADDPRACQRIMQYSGLFEIAVAVLLMLTAATRAEEAAAYPDRPVRFIAPVTPGGGVDTLARIVAEVLQNAWGQPVVVENRSGAGGNIGAEAVYRAEPDGYTLLFTPDGVLVINKMIYPKLDFDPDRFAPVSVVADSGSVLIVNPKIAATDVQQLIDFAKAHPGVLTYASPGYGTGSYLTAEMFKSMAGVDITHVPYKGTTPALTDVLGGQVSLMFGELGSVLPYIQAGKVRALAVTGEKRIAALPGVPTVAETLAGFVATPWNGIVAPPGTPAALADKISVTLAGELKKPDIAERLTDRNFQPVGTTPEQMSLIVKHETERWGRVISALGNQSGLIAPR